MNKFIYILLVGLFSFSGMTAQTIDEEIEFKYIKAKYLLDTERYEDAIKAFTEIIKKEKGYNDALVLRATAKYAMAAYKGTKKDILLYAGIKGINIDAVRLLGKADYKMGNMEAALISLETASHIIKDDAQLFEYIGNIYKDQEQLLKACDFWQEAATLGSSKARINAKKICGSTIPTEVDTEERKTKVEKPSKGKIDASRLPSRTSQRPEVDEDEPSDSPMKDNRTPEQKRRDNDDSLNNPSKDQVLKKNQKEDDNTQEDNTDNSEDELDEQGGSMEPEDADDNIGDMPEEDNTPNEIVIDEDLTLIVRGQGLGKRKILDQPNILILSDEDGIVAVDICVNKRGKVETAEFNTKLSTIAKKSLVSLAIRKSKDFWFEKNDYKEQCGVIMFKIKGS